MDILSALFSCHMQPEVTHRQSPTATDKRKADNRKSCNHHYVSLGLLTAECRNLANLKNIYVPRVICISPSVYLNHRGPRVIESHPLWPSSWWRMIITVSYWGFFFRGDSSSTLVSVAQIFSTARLNYLTTKTVADRYSFIVLHRQVMSAVRPIWVWREIRWSHIGGCWRILKSRHYRSWPRAFALALNHLLTVQAFERHRCVRLIHFTFAVAGVLSGHSVPFALSHSLWFGFVWPLGH